MLIVLRDACTLENGMIISLPHFYYLVLSLILLHFPILLQEALGILIIEWKGIKTNKGVMYSINVDSFAGHMHPEEPIMC